MNNEANKENINHSNNSKTLECHECDLEVNVPPLEEGEKAQCPRCGFIITAIHRNSIERILAFSITALIFCFPLYLSNFYLFNLTV